MLLKLNLSLPRQHLVVPVKILQGFRSIEFVKRLYLYSVVSLQLALRVEVLIFIEKCEHDLEKQSLIQEFP